MPRTDDLFTLPPDLPVPQDDGAADHLRGALLPQLSLPATRSGSVDLGMLRGTTVFFSYPRTGHPEQPPLVPAWNQIPGARGCTPQTCGFRDLHAEFEALGVRVLGISTQSSLAQHEAAERLALPFDLLSDASLALTHALALPTLEVAGETLLRRVAWIVRDGCIDEVFYPVFPPNRNAADVLTRLKTRTGSPPAA